MTALNAESTRYAVDCDSSSCHQARDLWHADRISTTDYLANLCHHHYLGAWAADGSLRHNARWQS
jgi:hypothetical protein